MSAVPKTALTYQDYLARERIASTKSEFYRGQVFAMAGGSVRHNTISGNVFAGLRNLLRGTSCRPFNSDQRIRIAANGLATYPDVSLICGEIEVDAEDADAIINPVVILEVLSKSSERYDRGKKFDLYRQLDSLQEYVLISQEEAQVERFIRQGDGSWNLTLFKGMASELKIRSLCSIPLSVIYEDVVFGPEEELPA